jgi:L-ribulose-5-phosphate 3-epimerase
MSATMDFGVNTYSYTLTHSASDCIDHLATRGISHFELMAAPEMRRYSLDLMSGMIQLAGDLGAERVLLGPGKANPLYAPPQEQLVDRFFAALDVLCPLARNAGTSLAVENIPICFAPDADSLMKLLDEYGNDEINIVYDVANGFFIGEDIIASLRRVSSRLRLVHLSDTHRSTWRHDAVGLGSVPFSELPPVLHEIGHHTPPVLEIVSHDADSAIFDSIARLTQIGWRTQ